MPMLERDVRELIKLTISLVEGSAPRAVHERFEQLTGMSIGGARYNSQHADVICFALDPVTLEVKGRWHLSGALPDTEHRFEQFCARYADAGAWEMFGRRWDWLATNGENIPMCLKSKNRPASADIGKIANGIFEELDAERAAFRPSPAQQAVARTYGDGDFSYLADSQGRLQFAGDLNEVGDTLLRYLMIELDAKDDCHDNDEAVRRLEQTIRQVQEVTAAVENLDPPAPAV